MVQKSKDLREFSDRFSSAKKSTILICFFYLHVLEMKDPFIYVFLKFKKVIIISNTYLKGKKV